MKRLSVLPVFLAAICTLAGAQEDDFSSGFGSFEEPPGTVETADSESGDEKDQAEITIGAETALRLFPVTGFENDDFFVSPLDGLTPLKLGFGFSAESSEYFLELGMDPSAEVGKVEDIINEAWFRLFEKNLVLQAGYIKTTWGKGDSFHVLDVLNGQDFSDFINSDSMDTKIPALMVKADILLGMNGKLELAYEPFRVADNVPVTGKWVPAAMGSSLETAQTLLYNGPNGDDGLYAAAYAVIYGGLYTSVYNQAYAAAIAGGADAATAAATAQAAASDPSVSAMAAEQAARQASAESSDMIDSLLATQQEYSVEDAQFGVRFTDSLNGFDFGLQYYYGFEKQPVPPDLTSISSLDQIDSLEFIFPRIHLFGADAAFAFGKFSFRCELAYKLMEDRDLTDTLAYTAGFDVTPGLSNLMINIQGYGEYKMKDEDDRAVNRVGLQLSDKWKNETIRPSVAGVYNFEGGDFMIKAELGWTLTDELELELSWTMFEGDAETDFGQFDDNDFAQILFRYTK